MGHHAPEVSQEDIATVDATQWWEEEEEEEETEAMDGVLFGKGYSKRKKVSNAEKPKRKKRKLPHAVTELMGNANLSFIEGNYEVAIDELILVIKQAPMEAEVYHTLATIYEAQGDLKKTMEFLHIAAALKPGDGELWLRLGRMAKKIDDLERMEMFFKRATRLLPQNEETMLSYVDVLKRKGRYKRAAGHLIRWAEVHSKLECWIDAALCFHKCNESGNAIATLKKCIDRAFSSDANIATTKYSGMHAVNLLVDIQISLRKFGAAVEVIDTYAKYLVEENSNEAEPVLVLDIAVRKGVCLVHLKELNRAEQQFERLYLQNVSTYQDLFLDVAVAYMAEGSRLEVALTVLSTINDDVSIDAEMQTDILFKMATCYYRVGNYNTAREVCDNNMEVLLEATLPITPEFSLLMVRCYSQCKDDRALQLFKDHLHAQVYDTRVLPSTIRRKRRMFTENNENVEEGDENQEEGDEIEEEDSLEDPLMGKKNSQEDDDLDGRNLLSNSFRANAMVVHVQILFESGSHEDALNLAAPLLLVSIHQQLYAVKKIARRINGGNHDSIMSSGVQSLWDLFFPTLSNLVVQNSLIGITARVSLAVIVLDEADASEICVIIKRCAEQFAKSPLCMINPAIEFIGMFLKSDKINTCPLWETILMHSVQLSLSVKNNLAATDLLWLAIAKNPSHSGPWNLLCSVLQECNDPTKWLLSKSRIIADESSPVIIVHANSLLCSEPKMAVEKYTMALKHRPNDPLLKLSTGVAFLNTSMSRTSSDRYRDVACAFGYLQQYQKDRCVEWEVQETENNEKRTVSAIGKSLVQAETFYNMGRAFHQLGLYNLAIPNYEKVLQIFEEEQAANAPAGHQLCRDTAHNLSILYESSGSPDLALYLTRKYNSI